MSARIRCFACNAEWPASIDKCFKCGQPLRGGGASVANQPMADTASMDWAERMAAGALAANAPAVAGVFADGDKLVMVEGCEMPRRCPLCNSDEVDYPTELTIRRQSKEMGGVSGLMKAGVDALAGWNYTGPVSVNVYFCDKHQGRLRNRLIAAAVVALACVLFLVVRYYRSAGHDVNSAPPWDVVLAIVGVIFGIVMAIVWASNPALVWFKPRKFVDRAVWVSGASREFVASLPRRG